MTKQTCADEKNLRELEKTNKSMIKIPKSGFQTWMQISVSKVCRKPSGFM